MQTIAARTRTSSITVIVPTRNESTNIRPLVERVNATLSELDVPWELLFVDDSNDATPDMVLALERLAPVRLVHRSRSQRGDGLGGAVVRGIAESNSEVVVVMDGDLQHPPELLGALIDPLLKGDADISVATRYLGDGGADGLDGPTRRAVSRIARRVAHIALPRTRGVSDPLGGFFAFRREVVDGVELSPVGFKILLEILARGKWTTSVEVPYEFAPRVGGVSKAGAREGARFVRHLTRLVPVRTHEIVVDLRGTTPTLEAKHRPHRFGDVFGSTVPRLVAIVAIVGITLAASLGSLASVATTSGDLAYLAIAPLLAFVVIAARARPDLEEPPIHDSEIDGLLGAGLLAGAALLLYAGSRDTSTLFWSRRLDLLAVPLVFAGSVCLLLGTRTLWRARAALVLALLTWPILARAALATPIGLATGFTARLVASLTNGLGLGQASADGREIRLSASGSTHLVHLPPDARTTATLVAFVLVAICVVFVRRDSWKRALAFIAIGALLAWSLRALLILLGIAAGSWARSGATRVLLGPWFDAFAVIEALALTALLVRARRPDHEPRVAHRHGVAPGRMPRVMVAVSVIAMVTAVVADMRLQGQSTLATPLGEPRLMGLSSAPVAVPNEVLESAMAVPPPPTAPGGVRWTRLVYAAQAGLATAVVDVIDGPSADNLGDNHLRAWYPIGWNTAFRATSVHLARGIAATRFTFEDERGDWIAVTWGWPVRIDGRTRFERVVVMPASESASLAATEQAPWLAQARAGGAAASVQSLAAQIARQHLETGRVPAAPPIVTGGP